MHYFKCVSETVCLSNRKTIERLFEASINTTNSEISFSSFIEEYFDNICTNGGVILYEDIVVNCNKHSSSHINLRIAMPNKTHEINTYLGRI